MIKNGFTYFLFVLLTGLLSGCFPMRHTNIPGVAGTVVDAKNHVPIVAADVILRTSASANSFKQISTVTKDQGRFFIKPDENWSIYIVPMDPETLFGEVTVKAKGYKEITKSFRTTTMGPGLTELGEIQLEQNE